MSTIRYEFSQGQTVLFSQKKSSAKLETGTILKCVGTSKPHYDIMFNTQDGRNVSRFVSEEEVWKNVCEKV